MRAVTRAISVGMLMMLVGCGAFRPPVRAQEYEPISVELPVFCRRTQEQDDTTFHIVMEPAEEHTPLPVCRELTINGQGEGSFQLMVSEPGSYRYGVFETSGIDDRAVTEPRVYTVTVFVFNDGENGLQYTISAVAGRGNKKQDALVFHHPILPAEELSRNEEPPFHSAPEQIRTGDRIVWVPLLLIMLGSAVLVPVMIRRGTPQHDRKEEKRHGDR